MDPAPRPLPPNQQLVARDKWPIIGEREPAPRTDPWQVNITGCVANRQIWSVADLLAMPQVERVIDLHCVTRWSKLDVPFAGVPLNALLEQAQPLATARFASFVARSTRSHSTSLILSELRELDALVALSASGKPLEAGHGGPVRVVVPGRYFYKSVKWLERIELLEHDRLGYWEQSAGYHNHAEPWAEERYLSASVTKAEMQRLLDARDFTKQTLLSLVSTDMNLAGLVARQAILRNADFRRANLAHACFAGANLSNAHFESANLAGADFQGADLEGADFRGANLTGADLRGASLFGATFAQPVANCFGLRVDAAIWEQLTPEQGAYLRTAIATDAQQ